MKNRNDTINLSRKQILYKAKNFVIYAKTDLVLMMKIKNMKKVRDHCHHTGKQRTTVQSICNLRYRTPKETPVIFQNGSTYIYHFIIKELAEKFEGQFEFLGENAEKYITF